MGSTAPFAGSARRFFEALLLALLVATPVAAARAAPTAERAAYDALVERARAGDRTLDLAELREAAVRADVETHGDLKEALWNAVKSRDDKAVQRAANAVLAQNYVDLDAHFFARIAARRLGDAEREELHEWIELGLLEVLVQTGDGRSKKTPMAVIDVADEYFILRTMGLNLRKQSLGKCTRDSGEVPCDYMDVVDEDGKESTWYFDVSIPMARLSRALGN